MKTIFLSLFLFLALITCSIAQNTSPFWSLSGNSNATKDSKLGTTNSVDLRLFTGNSEKMRINVAGSVGHRMPSSTAKDTSFTVTGAIWDAK